MFSITVDGETPEEFEANWRYLDARLFPRAPVVVLPEEIETPQAKFLREQRAWEAREYPATDHGPSAPSITNAEITARTKEVIATLKQSNKPRDVAERVKALLAEFGVETARDIPLPKRAEFMQRSQQYMDGTV